MPPELSRAQILAYRRRAQALDERLPPGPDSLRRAAWAGLQDSMPRAALLSIHARVHDTQPNALDDPSLVQLWGPRFSAYVVATDDVAPFTLGRLPDSGRNREFGEEIAARLDAFLAGRRMDYAEVGRALGVNPNALRYGAPTGTILIDWDGARRPTVRTVPRPAVDPFAARLELARRYLHVFGPTTADAFGDWAGIRPPRAHAAFEALAPSLTQVRTPLGDRWILAEDESAVRTAATESEVAPARLLSSGDTYFLLWGADRELLIPDAGCRDELWTSRVWPGALLVDGEVVGTWRRTEAAVTVRPWRPLPAAKREAVESEAIALPLPGLRDPITVRFE